MEERGRKGEWERERNRWIDHVHMIYSAPNQNGQCWARLKAGSRNLTQVFYMMTAAKLLKPLLALTKGPYLQGAETLMQIRVLNSGNQTKHSGEKTKLVSQS